MKYTRISITKQDCSMQQREVLTKILEYLYKMPNTVKGYTYTGANSIFHNFLEMPSSLASWTHWPASWPACWSSPSSGTWHTSRRQPSMMWSTVALDLSSSHILIWYFFAFLVFNFSYLLLFRFYPSLGLWCGPPSSSWCSLFLVSTVSSVMLKLSSPALSTTGPTSSSSTGDSSLCASASFYSALASLLSQV